MTELTAAEWTAARTLISLGLKEDLQDRGDLTCQALIPDEARAEVLVVARQQGRLAGGPIAKAVFAELDADVTWETLISDGDPLASGSCLAKVSGPLKSLLTGERTALNFLTHLSGIATLTGQFVEAASSNKAKILDTRKTHPGYRWLEKYAVRMGGGTNHRMGLFDGCLIKDNHLAAWAHGLDGTGASASIAQAVQQSRERLGPGIPIEVEVDTLDQLRDALDGQPEIVLLDNMPISDLITAVQIRDDQSPSTQLEASGGITLATIAGIAQTGVDRISIGGLTHSAPACDIAFDWSGLQT